MSATYPIAGTIGICDGFNLLLPGNLLADVVSAMTITADSAAAEWSVGELSWRGLTLPVISIEQLILNRAPRLRGSHIAIFHGTVDTEKMPFYGVPMQALPHNFKLARESDLAVRSDELDLQYCAMKVTARGVASIIPDIEGIENALLKDAN
jgi:chemosensory pili system protein ChpC